MPARRAAPRTRYDGALFRSLRESHNVRLGAVLEQAAATVGFEVCAHEHARQWERGQRNISDRLARILAAALTDLTSREITPSDFIARQAAA